VTKNPFTSLRAEIGADLEQCFIREVLERLRCGGPRFAPADRFEKKELLGIPCRPPHFSRMAANGVRLLYQQYKHDADVVAS
jgi:hypothetical protein